MIILNHIRLCPEDQYPSLLSQILFLDGYCMSIPNELFLKT